jgi:iron complex outermembrane receptor protein
VVSTNRENDKSNQTSEELRVTSSGDGPLRWLVGYFYQDFEQDFDVAIAAPGGAALFGTSNLFTDAQPTKVIQNSLFGEASYQMTSSLKLTAGVRRYYYDSSFHATESGVVATGSDAISHSSGFESSQGLNPKFGLSFQPSSDLLLYATAAKGFRPGGGNSLIPTSGPVGTTCEANLQANFGTTAFVPAPLTFGPDDVWSYELGEKMKLLGGRVALNTGIYFENWAGVQQTIPLPCGYAYQANAGDAHVYGGEVELQALLVAGLLLSANAGYSHATLVSATILNAGLNPGSRIENVPDWTSSVSLAYRHPISGDLTFSARVQDDFVGSRTDATYAINHLPSHNLAYLRIGVEADRWSAIMFVKNLFNKTVYLDNINQISVNLPTYNRVSVSQPLTIGIDLSYRFGR